MDKLFIDTPRYRVFFDGTVEAHDAEKTHELLLLGLAPSQISTNAITPDIQLSNSLVDTAEETISLSHSPEQIRQALTPEKYELPEEYLKLDLREHVLNVYRKTLSGSPEDVNAVERINTELGEIHKRGIENLFKTIVYVVDTFSKYNVVFGVGRGSSCACYILYLLGLNLVNPLKYNIPVEEFFH